MDEEVRAIAEQILSGEPKLRESNLIELRPYLESWFEKDWLEAKMVEYEAWANENSDPAFQQLLLHRPPGFNFIAAGIWAARKWEEQHEEDPSHRPSGGAKRMVNIACSLAVLELHCPDALDADAVGYLRKRLTAADQVWGVLHEVNTLSYFVQKGAQVEPRFLKKASRDEMIVRIDGYEIPVQCKSKKPGAGRVISQDSLLDLAAPIAVDQKKAGKVSVVRIGSTGAIRAGDVAFLRAQVLAGNGTGTGPELVTHEGRTFSIRVSPLSGQFTADEIREYLSDFGFHTGMVIGEPSPDGKHFEVNSVVGVDSNPDEKDKAWRSLKDSIKAGIKQLEGGPPGVVAVHYADPVADFGVLAPDREYIGLTLAKIQHPLPHIGAIMLSAEPDLQLPDAGGPGNLSSYVKEAILPPSLFGSAV